ncbi:MAG TPA: aminopeptidase N [Micromonosporaceae bacterium]
MPALTRTEATERAALLRVAGYDVDIDLTLGADVFGSTSTVRFSCSRPGASTFVEVSGTELRHVRLNGVDLDPGLVSEGRFPLTDLRPDNELVVDARMAYTNTGEGLHRFVDPADGEVYVYAMTFLDAAPRVFACFDQPDLKAPVTLRVTAPEDWSVVANGAVRSTAGGRWEFAATRPLATYFTTLAAGPYRAVTAEHDGIALGVYARASLVEHLEREAPEIIEVTRACLDRYHELFGVRYPFGKYDQVFVPEFQFGAMENPGCVTFRDDLIFRGPVTEAERQRRAAIIAHEMAHMWFGDLVTMRWWDDLWLNESFATYAGTRVTVEATRFDWGWTRFAVGEKAAGYAADQRPSTHPVSADVADTALALLNFDPISYAKGASVLRQLVAWLGDEAFFAGLRRYFDAHAFGNATLADLLAALSAASGRDLEHWARVWLREPGVDVLAPAVTVDVSDDRYTSVELVRRTRPGRPHRIGLGLYDVVGSALVRRERLEIDLDADAERVAVPALTGVPAADLLLVNDGDLTFAKVRLDPTQLATLPRLLPALDDTLARALLWASAWEATRDALLPAQRYVELAVAGLPGEPVLAVFDAVLAQARGFAVKRYLPPDRRRAALAALADACATRLDSAPAGSTRQLAAAKGWATCAGPDDVPRLRAWLAGDDVPTGLVVDAEVRWTVLYRLAQLGAATVADVAAEYQRDRTASGAEHAARCRAAVADPEAKAAAWRAVVSDDSLSHRVLYAVGAGFWQPEQQELTAPYVARYFADMPVVAARRGGTVAEFLAAAAFPNYAVDPFTVEAAEAMLQRADLHPGLRRAVVDATDDLRRSLAARELSAKEPA